MPRNNFFLTSDNLGNWLKALEHWKNSINSKPNSYQYLVWAPASGETERYAGKRVFFYSSDVGKVIGYGVVKEDFDCNDPRYAGDSARCGKIWEGEGERNPDWRYRLGIEVEFVLPVEALASGDLGSCDREFLEKIFRESYGKSVNLAAFTNGHNSFSDDVAQKIIECLKEAQPKEELRRECERAGIVTPAIPNIRLDGFASKKLEEVTGLIGRGSKLILLIGPPGTGKTYLAMSAAHELTKGGQGCWTMVTFHRSYRYEDFVEGLELTLESGQPRMKVRPGIFKEMVEQARKHPEKRFVIVIDEINRADVASVFGELLTALEYRGLPVRLPYSGEYLAVPDNVYIIATANNIDRGTFDIGVALRRRFDVVTVEDDENNLQELLEVDLGPESASRDKTSAALVETTKEIYRRINDLFKACYGRRGIGRLFFKGVRTYDDLKYVYDNRIKPLLEDYFGPLQACGNISITNHIRDIDSVLRQAVEGRRGQVLGTNGAGPTELP